MKEDRVIKLPIFRTMFRPVARKGWKCNVCKQPVEVGKRYVHYIDRRAHEIISYRFHDVCFGVIEAYCDEKHRTAFTPPTVRKWALQKYCQNCKNECDLHPCAVIACATRVKKKRKNST